MSSLIGEEISASGGWISFERFMEMALYTPGLGYYAANREIFGAAGDFITAPGIGTLFATCLAGQVAEALRALRPGAGDVIEIGAGAGDLAVSMLMALGKLDALPDRYLILETSAALQSRQLERLASLPGDLRDRVRWVENIPGEITGVVLANEVLDAMPVQRFRMDRAARAVPLGVTRRGDAFAWQTAPAGREGNDVTSSLLTLGLPAGYESESSRMVPAWISSIGEALRRGLMILVDYGYDRRTYYHPDRCMGTLMCHYRHHAHRDPFLWPGLQDITAHVDFTAVADAAVASGLEVLGYADQAGFLLEAGLPEIYAERFEAAGAGTEEAIALAGETRRLTMPQDMGEQFKVIAIGKDVPQPAAFRRRNLAHRLHA